jgi:DNA-binding NtrC family response regulator
MKVYDLQGDLSASAAEMRVDEDIRAGAEDLTSDFKDRVDQFEAGLIRETLAECGGVRTKAAHMLGVSERVLSNKIRKHKQ